MNTDEQIVEQAIEWMLQLEQVDVPASDLAAFERWRAADSRHAAAYANLSRSVQQFEVPRQLGASAAVLRTTLQQKDRRRKALKRIVALAGLSAGTGILLNQLTPLRGIGADLHTGTGQRQRYTLADGSVITLNARSSADQHIDQSQRLIRLLAGEIQVEVKARDNLPLAVETVHGSISALDGIVLVRYRQARTDVAALQASIRLLTRSGARTELPADQRTWFDEHGVATYRQIGANENSWVDGYYTASDTPLAELVDALRQYRKGVLRLDPAVAQLRISGTFPLDDTDRALSALASALPIEITRVSPYWVSISTRS